MCGVALGTAQSHIPGGSWTCARSLPACMHAQGPNEGGNGTEAMGCCHGTAMITGLPALFDDA